MRAILVSVDYADLLAITLPYNRHHFEEVWVVTSLRDAATQRVAFEHGAKVYLTEAFWADGAAFNKWRALEEGLDAIGRHGWLCLMDADVLWPKDVKLGELGKDAGYFFPLVQGQLLCPLRRMWGNFPNFPPFGCTWSSTHGKDVCPLPVENCWGNFPVHRNVGEWAGYSQVFHAGDPVLGPPPWHEVDWQHAGGADSFFQQRWAPGNKVRPPWECLHLGPAGENWAGRVTPYLDDTVPPEAAARRERVARLWRERRGKVGPERFRGERL